MGRPMGPPVIERLMTLSIPEPNSGCWLWFGSATPAGYGKIGIDGKTMLAHRASYIAFRGPIPRRQLVCHVCDVPACINPDHLFLGTWCDNRADAMLKGRVRVEVMRAALTIARSHLPSGDGHWTHRKPDLLYKIRRSGPATKRRKDCRFDNAAIASVRERREAGESQRVIAAAYGVSQSVISRVLSGKRYWQGGYNL